MLQTLCQEIARMHPNSILFFYLFKQPKEANGGNREDFVHPTTVWSRHRSKQMMTAKQAAKHTNIAVMSYSICNLQPHSKSYSFYLEQ